MATLILKWLNLAAPNFSSQQMVLHLEWWVVLEYYSSIWPLAFATILKKPAVTHKDDCWWLLNACITVISNVFLFFLLLKHNIFICQMCSSVLKLFIMPLILLFVLLNLLGYIQVYQNFNVEWAKTNIKKPKLCKSLLSKS